MAKNQVKSKPSSNKKDVKSNVKEKPQVNTKKVTKTEPKEKAESIENNVISKITEIYGNEVRKEIYEFPVSDLQTQTKNVINQYMIDCTLLPQNIVDAINTLLADFTSFVTNPMMMGMIPTIMDKDLIASNLLKDWVEPRATLLLEYKAENQKEDEKVNVSAPVTATQQHTPHVNAPQVNNVTTTQMPNAAMHGNNDLAMRQAGGTYQHNVNQQANVNVSPLGVIENKSIHLNMLNKNIQDSTYEHHKQQNLQHNYQPPVIDREKVFQDYAKSIMDSIKLTFQMNHWGYIPQDVLHQILQSCDKTYNYETVLNGKESFIKISSEGKIIETEKFAIQ